MKTLANPRDTSEILRRLSEVRPESARRWGRMSAHQMVCHLCDSCRMATGRKPVNRTGGVFERTIVKWIALYVPLAWPAGIVTSPEVDQECGGTRPADFSADLADLAAIVNLIASEPARVNGQVHPIFGRMSERAWLRWAYLHTDHHLRQFGV